MKLRLNTTIGEPLEVGHLDGHQRTALLEEARRRTRASTWGKWHHCLSMCAVLLQVGMVLSMFGPYGNSIIPDWGWLSISVLILMILFVPGSLLGMVDDVFQRAQLETLMLERGIRPAVCFGCRYDLRNSTSDTCPECGEVIAQSQTQG